MLLIHTKIAGLKIIFLFFFPLTSIITPQIDQYKTFTLSSKKLNILHELFVKSELQKDRSFKKFISEAQEYLNIKPASVMEKSQTPPGGNKHDYMSMAPYWWPDPSKPDGLPYIRKDGERNPEIRKFTDHAAQGRMIGAVETLSLAFAITNDSKYSKKAAQLLRVWFLDNETKMNPNLNFAQYIPGINTGRGIGIIETSSYYKIVDAIGILETSDVWSQEDDQEIRKWFDEYLDWLTTGKYGKDEANEKNNHGTWYDVQVVSISLFLGKHDLAKRVLNEVKDKRIQSQITSDGKQPLELARTKSWGYSIFNLNAFFHLALLGDNIGIDLWNYQSGEGASIRKALDYLLPFAVHLEKWKYKQIEKIDLNSLHSLLLIAKNKYDQKVYSKWIEKISGDYTEDRIENLLYDK